MNGLLKIIDNGEELTDVVPLAHVDLPDALAAICLRFSPSEFWIQVDPEDDSLKFVQLRPEDMTPLAAFTGKGPWENAIRKQVLWAWRLTNHQGYLDGIQLAFCEAGTGIGSVVIQLLGMASTIETSLVVRV